MLPIIQKSFQATMKKTSTAACRWSSSHGGKIGSSCYTAATSQSSNIIGYVTDAEGNVEFWNSYINISRVLDRNEPGNKITLRNNCQFVFGGDVCDRGPGDLHILRDIVQLKEDYPDRVHIILGNRDINKLRLPSELHPLSKSLPPSLWWVKESVDHENRLNWILKASMGSPDAYECRRTELSQLKHSVATDEDVEQSYLDSLVMTAEELAMAEKNIAGDANANPNFKVDTKALLLKYLSYGKIAHIIGDTMFVHGAITERNKGWLPPPCQHILPSANDGVSSRHDIPESAIPGSFVENNLKQWCYTINEFARQEVLDFQFNTSKFLQDKMENNSDDAEPFYWATVSGYDHAQPGSRLIQYGMGGMVNPHRIANPSVVYANYLSDGEPTTPSLSVAQWILESGVRTIVSGHQPHGDAPVIMARDNMQIITADTSYAINTLWKEDDKDKDGNSMEGRGGVQPSSTERIDAPKSNVEGGSSDLGFNWRSTRGVAVSEVLVVAASTNESASTSEQQTSRIFLHGVLSNGLQYETETTVQTNTINHGQKDLEESDYWIKWPLYSDDTDVSCPSEGSMYLLSKSEGQKVTNQVKCI